MRPLLSSLCLAVTMLLVVGCGPGKVKATGKILKDGKPLTVSDKGVLVLTFYAPDDTAKGKPIATTTKTDGTFVVTGTDGKGIAPGKYLVSIQAMDPYEKRVDKLKGKYATDKTKLTVDVDGKSEIVVNIDDK